MYQPTIWVGANLLMPSNLTCLPLNFNLTGKLTYYLWKVDQLFVHVANK